METSLAYPVQLRGVRVVGAYPQRLGQADISIGGVQMNGWLLAGGIAALLGVAYLSGSGSRRRRRRRLTKQIARRVAKLREL